MKKPTIRDRAKEAFEREISIAKSYSAAARNTFTQWRKTGGDRTDYLYQCARGDQRTGRAHLDAARLIRWVLDGDEDLRIGAVNRNRNKRNAGGVA